MEPEKSTNYVTSLHYSGRSGESYFKWQNQFGIRSGLINARKFQNFIDEADTILDFGCGAGHLLRALNAKHKIGVEVNPLAVTEARSYGLEIHDSIANVPNDSIDVVTSNHALEHVPYPISALREMHRVLRKGGKTVICVPIDDWRNQKQYLSDDVNHHLNTWTPQLIGNSFREAGFEISSSNIEILVGGWFPGTKYLWKHPRIFGFMCYLYGLAIKSRQIRVVATK